MPEFIDALWSQNHDVLLKAAKMFINFFKRWNNTFVAIANNA